MFFNNKKIPIFYIDPCYWYVRVTMTIVHYELVKLKQQEIEVRALVALLNCDDEHVASDAMLKLCNFAFPELVAKEINNQSNLKDWLESQ